MYLSVHSTDEVKVPSCCNKQSTYNISIVIIISIYMAHELTISELHLPKKGKPLHRMCFGQY